MSRLRALTGIKPSGTPHLGNYLGALRPALQLQQTHDTFYFIADYHALTTVPESSLPLPQSVAQAPPTHPLRRDG